MKKSIVAKIIVACVLIATVIAFIIFKPKDNKVVLKDCNVTTEKEAQDFIKLVNNQSENQFKEEFQGDKFKKNINVIFDNVPMNFKDSIYNYKNRYYFSLNDFAKKLGYSVNVDNNNIEIIYEDKKITIDLDNQCLEKDEAKIPLRGRSKIINGIPYVSLIDLTEIFNLKCRWDSSKDTIYLFTSKDNYDIPVVYNKEKSFVDKLKDNSKNIALVRLEDVAAGNIYFSDENMEKMCAVGDYCGKEKVPFHISWIPRYIEPKHNVDNDLNEDISNLNSHFLYVLDYLINKGGIVGLHGYTHQHGDEESIVGSEFNDEYNLSDEEKNERVKASIKDAAELNIPCDYFETPHYTSGEQFQSILEKYFDYVYEPCIGVWNKDIYTSPRNNRTRFIPTFLGYVTGNGIGEIVDKINTDDNSYTRSLFYHPAMEFDYITLTQGKSKYPQYTYDSSSNLKQLVQHLRDKKYNISSIFDI